MGADQYAGGVLYQADQFAGDVLYQATESEPLTLRIVNGVTYVKTVRSCGHVEYFPVNIVKRKAKEISEGKCETCSAIEYCKNGGDLGTGRICVGDGFRPLGQNSWAPGEFIPWLPADDERQPKGVV